MRFALQIMQASLLDALDGDAVVALTAAWITRTLEMAVGPTHPNRTTCVTRFRIQRAYVIT